MRPSPGRWKTVDEWVDRAWERKVVLLHDGAAGRVLHYAKPQAAEEVRDSSDARDDIDHDAAGTLVAAAGTLLFALASARLWSGSPLTLLGIAWLAPILLLARPGRRIEYLLHAMVLLLFLAAHWVGADNIDPLLRAWDAPGLDTSAPLWNLAAVAGVLLGAAMILAERQSRPLPDEWRNTLLVFLLAVPFAGLTFESWRLVDFLANRGAPFADVPIVKQVAMSVLWSLIGFALVLVGFAKRVRPLRIAALLLLGITLAKIFLADMKNVQAVWRILSFIALGSLLLGVSYLYHRQLVRGE
jgi:uncharacterized membrane protein